MRVEGQLLVNSNALARLGTLDAAGLDYLPEDYVKPLVVSGASVNVLKDWCDPFPGYYLY